MHISLFFINNHHTMHEQHVPDRQAHIREAMGSHTSLQSAPTVSEDTTKKRSQGDKGDSSRNAN